MASTAAMASTSSVTLTPGSRPQAGPLPAKRGELGFIEGVHEQEQAQPQAAVLSDPLPARHPADRRPPTPSQVPTNVAPGNAAPSYSGSPQTPTHTDTASTSIIGKRSFLGGKRLPKLMGVHFTTLLWLCTQLCVFAGTIIGWAFAAMAISSSKNSAPSTGPGSDQNMSHPDSGSSNIFVHVAFALVALAQLVLIERRIFRARAERYVSKHPGEMLPASLQRGFPGRSPSISMAIAPWSRPPLPTYAAALAVSGVGTGDVEDAVIAQPPPPAYGKTRGSTLVLSGYLRNSLRLQAREREDHRASITSERSDRPISFVSRDGEWEERRDADRARRIEEALAALEDSRPVLEGTAETISISEGQGRTRSWNSDVTHGV